RTAVGIQLNVVEAVRADRRGRTRGTGGLDRIAGLPARTVVYRVGAVIDRERLAGVIGEDRREAPSADGRAYKTVARRFAPRNLPHAADCNAVACVEFRVAPIQVRVEVINISQLEAAVRTFAERVAQVVHGVRPGPVEVHLKTLVKQIV